MKNWFVTIKQKTKSPSKGKSKSLDSSINYLLSKKHESHFYSEITDLENARLSRANILDSYDEMKQKHSKGVKNIASSFVLSIPADLYHPSVDEWREISNMTIKNFVENINNDLEEKQKKHLKKDKSKLSERKQNEYDLDTERFKQRLDFDEVKKLSTSVIHDESQKPLSVGETSGSHLNIVMSNIFNGEVIKHISQLGGVLSMKNAYSEAVKEKLGLDCDLYIPYSQRAEGEELKNFYTGETNNLDIVKIDNNTPHKNKILGNVIIDNTQTSPTQDKPFHLARAEKIERKKLEIEQQQNKIDETKKKNLKIVKAGRAEQAEIKKTRIKAKKEIKNGKIAKSELKEFLANILDNNFLKTFFDSVVKMAERNKLSMSDTEKLYEKEKKTLKSFEDIVLNKLDELEPGAIKKFEADKVIKDREEAEKMAKRHEQQEFKTQQQIDDEKFKKEQQKIKRPKPRDPEKESFLKRWGIIN